nr:hypothetical protein [uncultured Brevundimonas sp.]
MAKSYAFGSAFVILELCRFRHLTFLSVKDRASFDFPLNNIVHVLMGELFDRSFSPVSRFGSSTHELGFLGGILNSNLKTVSEMLGAPGAGDVPIGGVAGCQLRRSRSAPFH